MKTENVPRGNDCPNEYNKDKRIKKDDIQQLLEWMEKEPHLPKIGEFSTIQFYTSASYSLQRTKELINLHYSFRNDAPELFTGRGYEPPKFSHTFWDITYMFDISQHTKEGYRLVYCGFKDFTPSKFHLEHALAMFIKGILTIIMNRGSCEGYSFVFDMQGTSLGHMATVTVSLVRKFLFFAQQAIPLKVKQVNVINANYVFEKVMFLIKPFLTKELFNMITIDADINNFFSRIPKEIIPTDLGGTLPQSRAELSDLFRSVLEELSPEVMKELQFRSTKIQGIEPKTLHIMQGSFKKLDLD